MKKDITKQKTFKFFIIFAILIFLPTIIIDLFFMISWFIAKTKEEKTKVLIMINIFGKIIIGIILIYAIICGLILIIKNI